MNIYIFSIPKNLLKCLKIRLNIVILYILGATKLQITNCDDGCSCQEVVHIIAGYLILLHSMCYILI